MLRFNRARKMKQRLDAQVIEAAVRAQSDIEDDDGVDDEEEGGSGSCLRIELFVRPRLAGGDESWTLTAGRAAPESAITAKTVASRKNKCKNGKQLGAKIPLVCKRAKAR